MASVREFVRSLRPAGVPGGVAPAGVPADRVGEMAAELAPVLEALRSVEQQAAELVADARREAEESRQVAALRAAALVADARERADAARATAAASALTAAEGERAELLERARCEAAELAQRAAERLPELVERVVADVRATGLQVEQVR